MGFDRVNALFTQQRDVLSADEWDAARTLELGIAPGGQQERLQPHEALTHTVQQMHWVSLVCFLEQLDPAVLLLAPDLGGRVTIELAQLRGHDPLEAYAVSVAVLSAPGGSDHRDSVGVVTEGGNAER